MYKHKLYIKDKQKKSNEIQIQANIIWNLQDLQPW